MPDRDVRNVPPPPPHVRAQTAAPVDEVPDDLTGQHEVGLITKEQLAEGRARRSTAQNLTALARKHDRLEVAVGKLDGRLEGQDKVLDTLLQHSDASAKEREARRAHDMAREKLNARVRVIAAVLGIPVGLAGLIGALAKLIEVIRGG